MTANLLEESLQQQIAWRHMRDGVLVDAAIQFLNKQLPKLRFSTSIAHTGGVGSGEVQVRVFNEDEDLVLTAVENVEDFVSEHLFTKLLLVS